MTHAIEVRNVYREFQQRSSMAGVRRPVRAVDGVTFSLPAGDVLGVVGESGCGKSTLARLIMGLLPPTSGEVLVDGRSLAAMDRRERARLIQPVFQDPFSSLNPRQRIRDIVGLPLASQGDLPKARPSACRANSPAASASAWRSRVRSCCTRASWCATSRPARLMSPCRRRFSIYSRNCNASLD
jgi:ABC-type glutathione transport system ATPase component